jgi:hypothetical protein
MLDVNSDVYPARQTNPVSHTLCLIMPERYRRLFSMTSEIARMLLAMETDSIVS